MNQANHIPTLHQALPIADTETERGVLSSMQYDPGNRSRYLELLTSEHFGSQQHAEAFKRFKDGGECPEFDIRDCVYGNEEYFSAILDHARIKRWLMGACQKIAMDIKTGADLDKVYPQIEGLRDIENNLGIGPESILAASSVNLLEEATPPEVALRIGKEPFGTLGNFSLLIGKAKSRKTFAVVMAVASALGSNGPFAGELPENKRRVVVVDTEQGRYHVQKTGKRVIGLLGSYEPPENFEIFSLRPYDTEQRLSAIERIVESREDLGLLVIDGIRDVVTGINEEEQATMITDRLLRWTEEYQIHIITVLHQNKGDRNARGHLGTELINKAETTVSVERDPVNDEVSKFTGEFTRNKEFKPFGFMVNERGLPEVTNGWSPKDEAKKQRGITPHSIAPYKHREILSEIKRNTNDPGNSELIEQIKLAVAEKTGENIGYTKAKTFKCYWQNSGWIEHHGTARSNAAHYKINPQNVALKDVG